MTLTEKGLWLTSGWDFTPCKWGCVGFTNESARNRFANSVRIAAFYVVKHKGPQKKRGKVVGFAELSGEKGCLRNFISKRAWKDKEAHRDSKGRWNYAVVIKQAWLVIENDEEGWEDVESIFSNTYTIGRARSIGANGRIVKENDFSKLKELRIEPSEVFKQPFPDAEPEIKTMGDLLRVRKIKLCDLD